MYIELYLVESSLLVVIEQTIRGKVCCGICIDNNFGELCAYLSDRHPVSIKLWVEATQCAYAFNTFLHMLD